MQDYQGLYRQLEAVEGSMPSVGLVEETEEKLNDRISLYQVQDDTNAHFNTDGIITPAYIGFYL